MVIPKYDIGETVCIYHSGKLVERIVSEIQIIIKEEGCKVGYQFVTNDSLSRMLFSGYYTDEKEVFKSLDDFMKRHEICQL